MEQSAMFKTVTPEFSVAPQLGPNDFAEAAAAGYRLIINNRPDGESPGQLTAEQARAAAEAAGLGYLHIPISAPTDEAVAAVAEALQSNPGPILAYCRSGTRSITLWALAQARAGADSEGLIEAAGEAGYDLSALRGRLTQLAGSAK